MGKTMEDFSLEELQAQATKKDLEGRSKMGKQELFDALHGPTAPAADESPAVSDRDEAQAEGLAQSSVEADTDVKAARISHAKDTEKVPGNTTRPDQDEQTAAHEAALRAGVEGKAERMHYPTKESAAAMKAEDEEKAGLTEE